MLQVIITDTHYGVKQNSITWLNKQLDFIYKELIPFIQSQKEDVEVLHLGDVFDSRSSINPYTANAVNKAFVDLRKACKSMIIVGGNHDYYSPVESEYNINSVDLVLKDVGATIVTNEILYKDGDLFVPWFDFLNYDKLKSSIEEYKPNQLFTHADLAFLGDDYKQLLKNIHVYSGHIHTPWSRNNLHNLGSTYAITFADHDSERGFYTLKDNILTLHPNNTSIKFFRIQDDEIIHYDYNYMDKDDYIEVYVEKSNLLSDNYIEKIKFINSTFKNSFIIPKQSRDVSEGEEISNYNIEEICNNMISKELRDKFNIILQKIKEKY